MLRHPLSESCDKYKEILLKLKMIRKNEWKAKGLNTNNILVGCTDKKGLSYASLSLNQFLFLQLPDTG
jgi:hypothetical protein